MAADDRANGRTGSRRRNEAVDGRKPKPALDVSRLRLAPEQLERDPPVQLDTDSHARTASRGK
jgi:hypothetical protein